MATLELKKPLVDEIEMLTQKRDQLKIDIENMRHLVNQETEKKVMEARRYANSVEESRKKLELDRVELEKMAIALKKDREALATAQEKASLMFSESKARVEHVGAFILLVRRESEKL